MDQDETKVHPWWGTAAVDRVEVFKTVGRRRLICVPHDPADVRSEEELTARYGWGAFELRALTANGGLACHGRRVGS